MEITNINQLDFSKSYSYLEYLTWNFSERIELFKGYVAKMSPAPSRRHQQISLKLTGEFINYLIGKKCELYCAPFDVQLNENTVVQPDLCLICDTSKLNDKGCFGAPELIIEILSPGNTDKEMNRKFDLYEEAGVLEYWIVDPEHEAAFIYTLQNARYITTKPISTSGIIKSKVLEGLEIDLSKIFN